MQHTASQDSPLTAIQQTMREGRFDDAAAQLHALLDASPDDADALYMLAVCQRYLKDYPKAEATLERIKRLTPGHSRAHQESGHLHKAMGQPNRALRAYARACQLNPALEASFRGQVEILQAQGRNAEAEQARAQLTRLLTLPRPLVAVTDLIAQGKLARAEELCRAFLQRNPKHVEGMRLLADLGLRLGVLEDAEFLLESAVAFQPDHTPARIDYVQALRKRQKFAAALREARQLLDQAPEHPPFKSLYAITSMQLGDYDTALAMFDDVLEQVPGDPNTLTSKGHALKTCGRAGDAISAYRDALSSHPAHGEAYYSLANLKTYRFTDAELAAMHEQERSGDLDHMDRVYLNFALGKAYEDRKDYRQAFNYYQQGNDLKQAQARFDAERMEAEFQAQRRVCTPELFARHAESGHSAPDPIFIVGLPRAGSTLLEQILASHSQVEGTQELPNVISLAQKLRRRPLANASADGQSGAYPAILEELTAEELAAFGKAYLDDTRVHRQGAPFFIDKMPNNFRHIGLIRLMLPNARIIDARRHPLACCFSGFKQLFAEGQEFSYSLDNIGRYYRSYVGLMDHWDQVLPGHVLRVNHEDVVSDLEGQVRRLLDFCGLPFEPQCLEFYRTERQVRTPSSEQVRQPIFTEGVEQWRQFEPWLEPLKAALGDAVLRRHPPPE